MNNILVLGGTNFFGKKAVYRMIDKGYNVTIATRGNKKHPFGDQVDHIILDVNNPHHKGWTEIETQKWDAVFSNLVYTKEDAELMIEKFANLTNDFYYTSTMAVYSGAKDGYVEYDFNPYQYKIDRAAPVDYGGGKRQAEVVLFNNAPFDVTAFRFPIVLDKDDYTRRLHFYVERAMQEEKIYFENEEYKVNYVKGTTAAEAIVWAIENNKKGIYNVSTRDAVTIGTLMKWIEEEVGKEADVVYTGSQISNSPFSVSHDQYLISDKIEKEGFELQELERWMRPLIHYIASN